MKRNIILKAATDFCMTAALIVLMAYELVGQAAHEWLGIFLFVLFVLHHIWNRKWIQNIFKRRYTLFSILQATFVICIFLTMLGSALSGVILSRHALAFLPITGGRSFARKLHMVSAYWGLVFLSLHLGLHWNMVMGMVKKHLKKTPIVHRWILPTAAFLAAAYGVYAFVKRGIGEYMILKSQFVFFDFDEPLAFFLADYIAVLALFVWCGHVLSKWAKLQKKKTSLR